MEAERAPVEQLLKTARGQIEGILKMIEDDRYCMDISHQILAAQSLLKKANNQVLRGHMTHCVKEAFQEGNEDEKIDELLKLLDKMTK